MGHSFRSVAAWIVVASMAASACSSDDEISSDTADRMRLPQVLDPLRDVPERAVPVNPDDDVDPEPEPAGDHDTSPTVPPSTTTPTPSSTPPYTSQDRLLIPPGTIEDGTHFGYLVSQGVGSFVFDRADISADGLWSNTNPLLRDLPVDEELPVQNGTSIVVVVKSQRVVSATATAVTTADSTEQPVPGSSASRYVVPSPEPGASWADEHSAGYPAADIFVPSKCGGDVVSPVDGTLLEVRRTDSYDQSVDNPAKRGGRSVSILGTDGVRYYLAHFASLDSGLDVGSAVAAGQILGSVGDSGRASACHIHLGMSPPCPAEEWAVRRGVVWPFPYLDAWRDGEVLSPASEVTEWLADNPTACADAAADPNAEDS